MEAMHMEEWKDIRGFKNYMISNRGRVYSKKKHMIMKPTPDRKGYLRITFYELIVIRRRMD